MLSSFDTGPLTWVKGEIDIALDSATSALNGWNGKDDLPLREAATFLHQVAGALQMVDLEGLYQVCGALEGLLADMQAKEELRNAESARVALEGIAALRAYLDELMTGAPNNELRLSVPYAAILAQRGAEPPSPSDLFMPDLGARASRPQPDTALEGTALSETVHALRTRYQRGLRGFLMNKEVEASLGQMSQALQEMEKVVPGAAQYTFWWAVGGVLDGLMHGRIEANSWAKRMLGRVDMQMRRLSEGSLQLADRLFRDVLYFLSRDPTPLGRGAEARELFELDRFIETEAGATIQEGEAEALRPKLAALHDAVEAAKEHWMSLCSGRQDSLTLLRADVARIRTGADVLPEVALAELAQAVQEAAEQVQGSDQAAANEALQMEMAAALLLIQHGVDNYQSLGRDFPELTAIQAGRLHAIASGEASDQLGPGVPLLDEIARQAQEKLLLAQVAREIQTNLQRVEEILDKFFRNSAERADLPMVPGLLKQIQGALNMLQLDLASELVQVSLERIDRVTATEGEVDPSDLHWIAEALSMLGMYVDALRTGRDETSGLRAMLAPPGAEVPAEASVETVLDESMARLRDVGGQLDDGADQADVRDEMRHELARIAADADFVGKHDISDQAGEAIRLLDQNAPAGAIQGALRTLPGGQVHETPPSAVPEEVAETPEIDAELLEIYIEEAKEVLATISGHLTWLKGGGGQGGDAFVEVRRGFHTLKGSGRMVGLTDMAELAWEVEQTLNLWLREERPVTRAVIDFVERVAEAYGGWIAKLERQEPVQVEGDEMVDQARALRGEAPRVPTPIEEAAPVEPPVSVEVVETQPETEEATEPTPTAMPEETETPPAEEESLVVGEFEAAAEEPVTEEVVEESVTEEAVSEAVPASESVMIGRHEVSAPLLALFEQEAVGRLADLRSHLADMAAIAADSHWEGFTRAAHTLAGIARTTGMTPLADAAHAIERWAATWPAESRPLAVAMVGEMAVLLNRIADQLAQIKDRQWPDDLTDLFRHLAPESEHEAPAETELPPAVAEEAAAPADMEPAESLASVTESASAPEPVTAFEAATEMPEFPVEAELSPPAVEEPAAPIDLEPAEPETAVPGTVTPPAPEPVTEFEPAVEIPETPEIPVEPAPPEPVSEPVPEVHEEAEPVDAELLPIFLAEADELLPRIGETLRQWRANPADAGHNQNLQRALHTLKGSARMAGAMHLGDRTHDLETRVVELGQAAPDAAFMDQLERHYDELADLADRLRPVSARPAAIERAAPTMVAAKSDGDDIDVRQAFRAQAGLLDSLISEAGEVSVARARIEDALGHYRMTAQELTANVERLRSQLRELEIQAETQIGTRLSQMDEEGHFDPLEFDRFTRLQELTRLMVESVNDVSTAQENLLDNLNDAEEALLQQSRTARNLQQSLMRIRMVRLNSQAERLHRIVRQAATELNRNARLNIEGGDIELDRTVLDKAMTPFEHLLRNSVAHGIEDPGTRRAAGKQEYGQINLVAHQEGTDVVLTLSDDGAGLRHDKIRARAESLGWIKPGEMIERERLESFLFMPGFSTADQLSQVAGRGVGLDVVRSEIASVGGRVRVESEPGRWTRFTVRLPASLALAQVILVGAGTQTYAIPAGMVVLVREMKESVWQQTLADQMVDLDGQVFPLHSLAELTDQEPAAQEGRAHTVILLRSGDERVALRVDQLKGNIEAVLKAIGPQLSRAPGVAGATVLADGRVALILNPFALAEQAPQAAAHVVSDAEVEDRTPVVMVVDDSLTVRKITGRLLHREGYRVVTAKDGVEALELLESELPTVMLLDIEMPRMDGFEVARHVRAGQRTKDIPIIMITSRTADKHREHARQLGVNQYMGKPYQEDELLAAIAGFAGR